MTAFAHLPILLPEVVQLARQHRCLRLLDCTAGGGGHSAALLQALPQATLVALDRDAEAVAAARQRLLPWGDRAQVRHTSFGDFCAGLPAEQQTFDFVLADFGVSSYQLDAARRGFSFRQDGPLDMRMDGDSGESAAALIARLDATQLADILWRYGEERHSRRVARAILAARPTTTLALAEVVRAQLPRPKKTGGPRIDAATRTFQALRMAVNDELGQIEVLLASLPRLLAPGGVVVAISFHSLEDRLVKRALAAHAAPCICPPKLPVCACGRVATLAQPVRQAVRPGQQETAQNPRARSAKLRWARRLPEPVFASAPC